MAPHIFSPSYCPWWMKCPSQHPHRPQGTWMKKQHNYLSLKDCFIWWRCQHSPAPSWPPPPVWRPGAHYPGYWTLMAPRSHPDTRPSPGPRHTAWSPWWGHRHTAGTPEIRFLAQKVVPEATREMQNRTQDWFLFIQKIRLKREGMTIKYLG